MRFSFKKGLIFIEINTRWMLIRRLYTGYLQFENEVGEIRNIIDKEVLNLWYSGVWIIDIDTLGQAGDVIYMTTPAELSNYPTRWQEVATRRMHYVNAVGGGDQKFNKSAWQNIIKRKAEEIADKNPPCAESVFHWVKKYRITKSISSLLPKMKSGKSRKEDSRYSIFEDVVQTAYLMSQKPPIIDIVEKIRRKITVLNTSLAADKKIKQVGQSTIYRWIQSLRSDITDASRLGADVARKKYRIAKKHLQVSEVLERVEIDNTPLDLIVIDETTKLPLGRPWLTLAIDVHSRMILGFYISFNSPSAYSVLQCLKQAVLPKEQLLAQFPDIKNEWPVYGIPNLIALDNAMDFHSDALKQTCFELGIQILFCPAATPWTKPHVERVLRTLTEGLIHSLPGTTFSNIIERGDYPSEDMAAIDINTLTHIILKWIVDIYQITPHRGLSGNTPLIMAKESAKTKIIELPVFAREIEIMAGIPAERSVFHYGIELDGLHYNSKQLQEIRKISGENLKVRIKFYEDQVAYVEVFDPFLKEYLRVNATHDQYVEGLHRATHRLARAHARKKFGDEFTMQQLIEARHEIEEIVQKAIKSKKMADRKSAAVITQSDSTSVLSGVNKNTKKVKKTQQAAEVLDSGLEDDLPAIKNLISHISLNMEDAL